MQKNLIDLTSEDNELLPPTLTIESSLDNHSINNNKPLEPSLPKVEVSNYDWIPLKEKQNEFSYLESFLDKHKNDEIKYKKLDLDHLDPNYEEPPSHGWNVAEKIEKRIAKEGILYSKKRHQDEYDFDDDFVDDSANPNQAMLALGRVVAKYDDFILFAGAIDAFRRSSYAKSRIKSAEDVIETSKSKKGNKAKKSNKEPTKRKADDNISRPEEDLKKNKIVSSEMEKE